MSDQHGPQPYDPGSQQPYGQPYGQPHNQPYGQPYGPGPQLPYGQLGEVPLSAPLYGASIGQAIRRFWKKYATFSGRASRSEFWWWFLVSYGVGVVLGIANQALAGPQPQPLFESGSRAELNTYFLALAAWGGKASILGGVWNLVTLVGTLSLSTRRLHDTNRSGWWYLLAAVPLVAWTGLLAAAVFLGLSALASTTGLVLVLVFVVVALVSLAGAVVLIVFWASGPRPQGQRYDRAVA